MSDVISIDKLLFDRFVRQVLSDEWGINEDAFITLSCLVVYLDGKDCLNKLMKNVHATDGRYYVPDAYCE